MPGVPSNRGCEACMRARKKCDLRRPRCSRCVHQCVPCIGAGVQRYKFLDLTSANFQVSRGKKPRNNETFPLCAVPSISSRLAAELVDKLQITNPRFDFCSSYGSFTKLLPNRLGSDKILDASVAAFLTAVKDVGSSQLSPMFWKQYGHALEVLRISLKSPKQADIYHILASIYMIWICQGWIGTESASHGSGIMAVFSNAIEPLEPKDEFQHGLLLTISSTVTLERMFDPKIPLNPSLSRLLFEDDIMPPDYPGPRIPAERRGLMGRLFRLPDLMIFNDDLQSTVKSDYDYVGEQTAAVQTVLEAAESCPWDDKRLLRLQGLQCLHLSVRRILNTVLQVHFPEDVELPSVAKSIADDMEKLIVRGSVANPLGAAWIPLGPIAIWGTSTSDAEKARMETLWRKFWNSRVELSVENNASRLAARMQQLRLDAAMYKESSLANG